MRGALQQIEVRLRRGYVKNIRPQKATRKVHHALNVLFISFNMCCDWPLFHGHATFVRLAVDGAEPLVSPVTI